jgi:hypothetical protein
MWVGDCSCTLGVSSAGARSVDAAAVKGQAVARVADCELLNLNLGRNS